MNQQNVIFKIFNFKGYPETSMCVVAAYLFIEHSIDVLHVFKVNCELNGVRFFDVPLIASFPDRAKSID